MITDIEKKLVVTSGESDYRGKKGRGTIRHKISYKEILYNMENIAQYFIITINKLLKIVNHNIVHFVIYIILCSNYTSIFKM